MLKLILLIISVSADGFAVSLGLGSAGIKIPIKSTFVISFIGTLFLWISVIAGGAIGNFIDEEICKAISTVMLFSLGVFNLLSVYFGRISERKSAVKKKKATPVTMFFDGKTADTDNSKDISLKEATVLSVALSADSIITGISVGAMGIDIAPMIILTFLVGITTVQLGSYIGKKFKSSKNLCVNYLCGAILIALAFLK